MKKAFSKSPGTKPIVWGFDLSNSIGLQAGAIGIYGWVVLPSMERIADQIIETVSLMRLFNKYAICIESIEGKHVVRVIIEQGRLQPLYSGASSKVLLSGVDESEWDDYLDTPIEPLTSNTIVDLEEYKAQIRHARDQGYATSDGEIDYGGRAIAIPIVDGQKQGIGGIKH